MHWAVQFGLAALLVAGAHDPRIHRLLPEKQPPVSLPSAKPAAAHAPQGSAANGDPNKERENKAPRAERLRPESRIEIQRFVNGEFARVVRPLPSHKKGYRVRVGEPVDERALRQAVANTGSAGNPGDLVQITKIEFKGDEIVVDINGGSKKRRSWRDRIQLSIGGVPTATRQSDTTPGYQAAGSTLVLEFGGPLPDMTPEELKEYLSDFLDFSTGPSAAEHWYETLPPEYQQAITEKRALVGMDREMVVAALGKPGKKVRERTPEGLETEDWIYGTPPGKTIFVKFAGDQVIEVKEFPQ